MNEGTKSFISSLQRMIELNKEAIKINQESNNELLEILSSLIKE